MFGEPGSYRVHCLRYRSPGYPDGRLAFGDKSQITAWQKHLLIFGWEQIGSIETTTIREAMRIDAEELTHYGYFLNENGLVIGHASDNGR